MTISGEGVLLEGEKEVQKSCGRSKEQEEGIWVRPQGAKERVVGNDGGRLWGFCGLWQGFVFLP